MIKKILLALLILSSFKLNADGSNPENTQDACLTITNEQLTNEKGEIDPKKAVSLIQKYMNLDKKTKTKIKIAADAAAFLSCICFFTSIALDIKSFDKKFATFKKDLLEHPNETKQKYENGFYGRPNRITGDHFDIVLCNALLCGTLSILAVLAHKEELDNFAKKLAEKGITKAQTAKK